MGQPRKFPLLATLMMLCGVAILCTLGMWQLDRLTWKEGLLANIEAQSVKTSRIFTTADLTPENEFQTGTINGTFLNDKTIKIVPRTYDGKSGAHIITPFKIGTDIEERIVLVNRGWISAEAGELSLETPRTITAMIRKPPRPNMFTPHNDTTSDEWYRVSYDDIKTAHRFDNIALTMLYETCTDTPRAATTPNPCALTLNINNNHLQYAFFWFAMGLILIVIYILRFWRKPRH